MYLWFWKSRKFFFWFGAKYKIRGISWNFSRGPWPFWHLWKIPQNAHYMFCLEKKISRTFKISGTLIVKHSLYSRPLVFFLLSCFGLWNWVSRVVYQKKEKAIIGGFFFRAWHFCFFAFVFLCSPMLFFLLRARQLESAKKTRALSSDRYVGTEMHRLIPLTLEKLYYSIS